MLIQCWLAAVVAVFILMNLTFLVAFWKRKNDFADIVWGPGFMVAALAAFAAKAAASGSWVPGARESLAFLLVSIWALRLAYHVGARNLGAPEDVRYANWRKQWGGTWVWRTYLQVFILQGLLMLMIASPLVWMAASYDQNLDGFALVGAFVWVIGFIFESVGDRQLAAFRRSPANKGKIMNVGLWSWSRHPNYFGEVVQWWGLGQFALPLPYGWITLVSPVAITFFILKVSGVPMLEKLMEGRPGFAEYKRRTSVFFPLPPGDAPKP